METSWRLVLQIVPTVLLVLIILGVLAYVPQAQLIGARASSNGVQEVQALVHTVMRMPRGQTLGRRVTESDMNAFLAAAARRMNAESFSVEFSEGVIRARLVVRTGLFDIGSKRIRPKVSYQATFVPVQNRLRFKSASRCLLPLFGPMKSMAVKPMYERASKMSEWVVCKDIYEIQAHEDALDITFKR